jgi:hypothetical protein
VLTPECAWLMEVSFSSSSRSFCDEINFHLAEIIQD